MENKIKLNKGHQWGVETGRLTPEEAQVQQERNNETVRRCNEDLLQRYYEVKNDPKTDPEIIQKLEKYLKSQKLI